MEAPQHFGNLFDPRSETSALDNEGLVLWKKLVHKVLWESAFEGIEVHKCFGRFLGAQEQVGSQAGGAGGQLGEAGTF